MHVDWRYEWIILAFSFFWCRWAGTKPWQKMQQGQWLIGCLGAGMAILSLISHSWGQDTEGTNSQNPLRPSLLQLTRWRFCQQETGNKGKVTFDCQKSSMAQLLLPTETVLLPIKDGPNTFKSDFAVVNWHLEAVRLAPEYQFKEWLHC